MSSNVVAFTSAGGAVASNDATLQAETSKIAIKCRLLGDFAAKATGDFDDWALFEISAGTHASRKVEVTLHRDAGTTQLYISAKWQNANGTTGKSAYFDLASITQTDYYIIYLAHDSTSGTPLEVTLFDSSGTVVAADNSTQAPTGAIDTTAGNGKIYVGLGSGTYNGAAITVDGIAVYAGAVLSAGARWSAPAAGDSNLVGGTTFDDGAGATATSLKSGGQDFALTNPTWAAGGTWDNAGGGGVATSIAASAGDAQTAEAGTELPIDLEVLVLDDLGAPLAGVDVDWAVGSGGGSITPATSTTDGAGHASATATLGATEGAQTFTATATGLTGSPVTFDATATAPGSGVNPLARVRSLSGVNPYS